MRGIQANEKWFRRKLEWFLVKFRGMERLAAKQFVRDLTTAQRNDPEAVRWKKMDGTTEDTYYITFEMNDKPIMFKMTHEEMAYFYAR